MKLRYTVLGVAIIALSSLAGTLSSQAAEPIKVGMSAALSGYLAQIDRAVRDGALLAIEKLNAEGGVLGRKFEITVEDMKSEPQASVTAVTKLIHSDKVDILVNGASSAGNLAVSPLAARASLPLLIQGLLPKKDSPEYKWTFTTYPPFVAEIAPRFEYLSQKTNVKKVGVLYDPTPYSRALNKVGAKVAAKNGITVVGEQQFKFSDTDLSVHIKKLVAAGAEAIIRNGVGPATIVAAKNMKELNIKVPMIATIDDLSVQRAASGAIGTQLLFVGTPVQVYEALAKDHPSRKAIGEFLAVWKPKYGDRDGMWASRGWDAMHLAAEAIKRAGTLDGAKVRDALESINGYQLTTGNFKFSPDQHQGIVDIPTIIGRIDGGKAQIVQ